MLNLGGRWSELAGRLAGYSFEPSAAERKVLRKRKKIRPSDWAERHRVLSADEGAAMPGPWRRDTLPYQAGIMDASYFPTVQSVVVCAAPQTGKSELVNDLLGYAMDRDPGPALLVYPDQETTKHNISKRITPLIENSPRLASYRTGDPDDISSGRIHLQHMSIYGAWARSPSSLANKAIKHLILDEVDKYEHTVKKEATAIALGRARQRTYSWSKHEWVLSSPSVELGPIWQELNTCELVFHYKVRCPKCGTWQRMHFDQFRWAEEERDPERIESKKLAWYECEHCEAAWDDADRDKAVLLGGWFDALGGRGLFAALGDERSRKLGFHIPSWLSRFVSLSEVAAAFLRGQKKINPNGWREKLQEFVNNHKAEPWTDMQVERPVDRVLALRDERPNGMVPGPVNGRPVVAGITAMADVQKFGCWYEIIAWGWGHTREAWQVRAGFVPYGHEGEIDAEADVSRLFEPLMSVVFDSPISDPDGNKYAVEWLAVDCSYATDKVYTLGRLNRGRVLPFEGKQTQSAPIKPVKTDFYPNGKPIPGGLIRYKVNVTHFKNAMAGRMEINRDDPGAWHLNRDCSDEWCGHLVAEYQDDKGFWQCPDNRPNHGWDCSVGNLALAELRRVHERQYQTRQPTPERQEPGGGWLPNVSGWKIR